MLPPLVRIFLLRHDILVDVVLERSDRFVVVAHALLRELDADDVRAPARRRRDDPHLRRDTEEVGRVDQAAVLDEQAVAAEARARGEDHTRRLGGELDLGQRLVGHVVDVRGRAFGDLGGARVVGVLAARRHRDLELHREERLEILGGDRHIVERQHAALLFLVARSAIGFARWRLQRELWRRDVERLEAGE